MKASILFFSPSGNTADAAGKIKKNMEVLGWECASFSDITGDSAYFSAEDEFGVMKYLNENIADHDILFVGAPVYAHHFQYHVLDLIKTLPRPDGKKWGRLAVPFVTYGGISSGIALEECGKHLHKSGRIIPCGIKISSPHRVTRVLLDKEYNSGIREEDQIEAVRNMLMNLSNFILTGNTDNLKSLKYQGIKEYLKAILIFNERVWHEKRYPKAIIEQTKCIGCGKCVLACPVCRLEKDSSGNIKLNEKSGCIHCFNCVVECPVKAVRIIGDLERARKYFAKLAAMPKENPANLAYPE